MTKVDHHLHNALRGVKTSTVGVVSSVSTVAELAVFRLAAGDSQIGWANVLYGIVLAMPLVPDRQDFPVPLVPDRQDFPVPLVPGQQAVLMPQDVLVPLVPGPQDVLMPLVPGQPDILIPWVPGQQDVLKGVLN